MDGMPSYVVPLLIPNTFIKHTSFDFHSYSLLINKKTQFNFKINIKEVKINLDRVAYNIGSIYAPS